MISALSPSVRASEEHNTTTEGVRLGLVIGVITWLWVAGFDFITGEPFQTLRFFGDVAGFTLLHFLLCVAYGYSIMSAVHASLKEASVIYALIFSSILFQAGFVMLTILLDSFGLGSAAWGRFLGGNLVAAVITYAIVARRHPLLEVFRTAEANLAD
jgi:hypothetical protein